MDLLEAVIAGLIQAFLEWIPVSSEGFLFSYFSFIGMSISQAFVFAIFFHVPTALAALVYFWKDFRKFFSLKWIREFDEVNKFLITSTLSTAVTAVPLYLAYKFALESLESIIIEFSYVSLLIVGVTMIVTGLLLKPVARLNNGKFIEKGTLKDYVTVGLIQGFAIIPGVTRSGVTIAALIWRGFHKEEVIRGSFLLAPFVSLGAFALELITGDINVSIIPFQILMTSLGIAFLVSIVVIKGMLEVAKKLDYRKFLIFIGLLMAIVNLIYLFLTL